MKAGLTTSLLAHAAFLGIGLFTVAPPRAFDVDDVESFPVDIIPIESITQVQEGDREAPEVETPSPKPTRRVQPVENALKTGDNDQDLENPPTPELQPKPVETAVAPKAIEEPAPEPDVKPEPQPEPEKTPDPVADTIAEQEPDPESAELPEDVPVPTPRPKTPPPQTAKTPKTEQADQKTDQVAALLNKEKAAGGGAKRATKQASLGGERTTKGSKLTQSEMDALRGQIQRCWNVPAGVSNAEDLKISIKMRLDKSGAIEGRPEVVSGGGGTGISRIAAESARRAVLRCAPFNLPAAKYDAWADVIVHFDPSDMF